ncbi:MAG: NADH-quinone oxidoreductase subunit L [Candidatus Methylomirabilales bacterium]
MQGLLWLPPACGYAGFLVLALLGRRLSARAVALVGAGSIGLAAAGALALAAGLLRGPGPGGALVQPLWTWVRVEGLRLGFGLRLDALALVMVLVVTVVGFLIHLYAVEFMEGDEGYARFFAYTNLFVGAMLTLVLADGLLLLYVGWEGVGLCSYLLIGFWYRDPANGRAARKAFTVTRVGDAAMAIGLCLIAVQLGTLEIAALQARAAETWGAGSTPARLAAALLLAGALGKSAQLPLHTWLPDAMAGPTPVSALIHAATMVTAGVYLIARMHGLFELAPAVLLAVGVLGAATLLLAGASALAQHDIKRVLAYSTISQIGYMFLALGVGAWSAAVFHLATHAFFKALLFLGAGAVIFHLHHEHDLFRMGGLRRRLPLVFWTFLAGAASLAGLPLLTAGFYSKDWILWEAWASGHPGLWAAGILGAGLTALYTTRLVVLVFFGDAKTAPSGAAGPLLRWPLVVLAAGALLAGFLEVPRTLGRLSVFSDLLGAVLPAPERAHGSLGEEALVQAAAAGAVLLGIGLAAWLYAGERRALARLSARPAARAVGRFWLAGWGLDALYDALVARPLLWAAAANRGDLLDRLYLGLARASALGHRGLSRLQSGGVRRYAGAIAAGAVGLLLLGLLR